MFTRVTGELKFVASLLMVYSTIGVAVKWWVLRLPTELGKSQRLKWALKLSAISTALLVITFDGFTLIINPVFDFIFRDLGLPAGIDGGGAILLVPLIIFVILPTIVALGEVAVLRRFARIDVTRGFVFKLASGNILAFIVWRILRFSILKSVS